MTYPLDRRHSPRIPCDLAVDYTTGGAYARMGRITNIGTAGLCLATQRVILPVGLDLSLHFRLPLGKRPIQAGGTVRWVVEWAAGVELIKVRYQDQDEIWRYYVKEAARQRGILLPPPEPSPEPPAPIQVPDPDPTTFHDAVLEAWRRFIRDRH